MSKRKAYLFDVHYTAFFHKIPKKGTCSCFFKMGSLK